MKRNTIYSSKANQVCRPVLNSRITASARLPINQALDAATSGCSSWLQAALVPTGTTGLEQLRCRSNKAALRQCRISTSSTCNLDWPSAEPDRLSPSQPRTRTMGVFKQLSRAHYFHGVPLINSPGPRPYGEQALKFLCSVLPACVTLSLLVGLCHPRSHLSLCHWELPDHWAQPNSPFLQNSSICKPGNSAGQSCSQSLGHYHSKLIPLKSHISRRNSHTSIKPLTGFCVQRQPAEHFLTAINSWLPWKKYFSIPNTHKQCNPPNLLSCKTKS